LEQACVVEIEGPKNMDGRKHRKKSPPRKKTELKRPEVSLRMKRLWADPTWRAAGLERLAKVSRESAAKGQRRFGVYDGMRRAEAEVINQKAAVKAKEIVAKMKTKGIVDEDIDPRAEQALTAAVQVLETPTNQQTKLAAARLLLDFLKSKPTSKQEVTVNAAEQWLAAIAEDNDPKEEEPEAT
jgi:hypothetical protein